MIHIKLVRETPDVVRASQKARGEDPGIVDAILAADEARRSSLGEVERVRAEQKAFSKQVALAKGEEEAALVAQAKDLATRVGALETHQQPGGSVVVPEALRPYPGLDVLTPLT